MIQHSKPSTANRPWLPGPPYPLLADGVVDVWRVDLGAMRDDLDALLCSEECARAARFLNERGRKRWRRARGVLRELLGRYLDRDPRTLRLAKGAHGKPSLIDDAACSTSTGTSQRQMPGRLSFNLSHSRALALYAFSRTGEVGIDVEVARARLDEVAIAARAFGRAEARRLEGLNQAIRQREFLRAWVRHEALLKCRGTGIGAARAGASANEPWIAQLEMGSRAAAAVAVECTPHELRCWDWKATSSPLSFDSFRPDGHDRQASGPQQAEATS